MGEVDQDRTDQFVSLAEVRRELSAVWTLTPLPASTGGPARYVRVEETGGVLGFITPLSHTFCDTCNRVRLTCTGTLHTCLGQDDATDLRGLLRAGADDAALAAAVRGALLTKPRAHAFDIGPPGRGAQPGAAHVGHGRLSGVARVLLFGRLAEVAGWREREVAGARLSAVRAALAASMTWRWARRWPAPGVQAAVDAAIWCAATRR